MQEPHSTSAIWVYFKRVHHLLLYKMRFYFMEGIDQANPVLNRRMLLTEGLYQTKSLVTRVRNIFHWYIHLKNWHQEMWLSVPFIYVLLIFIVCLDLQLQVLYNSLRFGSAFSEASYFYYVRTKWPGYRVNFSVWYSNLLSFFLPHQAVL